MEDSNIEQINILQPNIKYYDVDWIKIKTIKDIKMVMQVLINKIQIDHNDNEDIGVFSKLKPFLIESTENNIG